MSTACLRSGQALWQGCVAVAAPLHWQAGVCGCVVLLQVVAVLARLPPPHPDIALDPVSMTVVQLQEHLAK